MRYQEQKRGARRRFTALLFSGLISGLLLLSACSTGGGTTANSTPTTPPTPAATIDPALKSQGTQQLQTLQQWIALMKKYNGNYYPYQSEYDDDQKALSAAQTNDQYQAVLTRLGVHIDSIKFPATQAEAQSLLQQLQQQVASWGQQHTYHNDYDNTTYPLGFEYGSNGVGGWAQDELTSSKTLADYQQTVDDLNMYLTNFAAYKSNFSDKTPYNQVHQSDLQLMQNYQYMDKKVVIVSVSEQAMRVYQNGKLVNAFLITTGRPALPTPPGTWWVEGKQSPTVYKSSEPQGSPLWYPDTPINYSMQYHSNGYFIHDSWWRNDYGPGTNFPHADSSGDIYSSQGSHGCVNMSKDNAGWLYNFVELYTKIVIY